MVQNFEMAKNSCLSHAKPLQLLYFHQFSQSSLRLVTLSIGFQPQQKLNPLWCTFPSWKCSSVTWLKLQHATIGYVSFAPVYRFATWRNPFSHLSANVTCFKSISLSINRYTKFQNFVCPKRLAKLPTLSTQ